MVFPSGREEWDKRMKNRILVIDDDQSTRLLLETFLSQKGYAVDCVEDAATMRESLGQREYPLILLDLNLPDADGLDLIEETKTTNPDIAIIIITAYGSIENRSRRCAWARMISAPNRLN